MRAGHVRFRPVPWRVQKALTVPDCADGFALLVVPAPSDDHYFVVRYPQVLTGATSPNRAIAVDVVAVLQVAGGPAHSAVAGSPSVPVPVPLPVVARRLEPKRVPSPAVAQRL